jgi:hypothetical protein
MGMKSCEMGSIAIVGGLVLSIMGSLLIAGDINPLAGGWTIAAFGTHTLVLPIIGALSAYGIVSSVVTGGLSVAIGILQIIGGSCCIKNKLEL